MANGSLMKLESTGKCSKGSILQYFRLSLSLKANFGLFFGWPLKTGFTVYAADIKKQTTFSDKNSGEIRVKYGPQPKKTCLLGLRTTKAQTSLRIRRD